MEKSSFLLAVSIVACPKKLCNLIFFATAKKLLALSGKVLYAKKVDNKKKLHIHRMEFTSISKTPPQQRRCSGVSCFKSPLGNHSMRMAPLSG
jgi:hypothetical protein